MNTPEYFSTDRMKQMVITIRNAGFDDTDELRTLFKDTVTHVNTKDYTAEETADWAACGDDDAHWHRLMGEYRFMTAEDGHSRIVGFTSVDDNGHLHSMFTHKDFLRQGIASALLEAAESHARGHGATRMTAEVSITARPFFEKRGYTVTAGQRVKAKNMYMTNFRMEKRLTPAE